MNRMLHFVLCAALLAIMLPSVACAGGGPPESAQFQITELFPGGDVLRPGSRSSGEGYTWYLGIDAGITYSMFSDGPVHLVTPISSPDIVEGSMITSAFDGNGVGFYVGATADFPLTESIGLVVKANFHNRFGTFGDEFLEENIYVAQTDEFRDVIFGDDIDWSFRYFGIDLLARIQLMENSLYLLAGPSLGFLLGNTAETQSTIVTPNDVWFTESDGTVTNMVTSISGDGDIDGFESSRVDLKFGLGTWIELMDKLFLTPEITLAYPLTGFVSDKSTEDNPSALNDGESKLGSRVTVYPDNIIPTQLEWMNSSSDFNMITIFFTVGLRWQID